MGAAVDVIRGNSFSGGQYPVYFPGNGATEPLTSYGGGEFPDPLQACPGYSVPTGLPVFIQVGGNVSTVAGPVHSFTGNGVPLNHCVIDSTNSAVGSYLVARGGVILIPQTPLQTGVKYVVALTVNGQPYTWSFTVGPFIGCPYVIASAAPPSPSAVGTTIKVVASATACANPLYEFWVLPPGGSAYQLLQAYSTTAIFTWNTSGLAPGDYRFSVWARDANSTGLGGNQFGRWDAYDDSLVYTLATPACSGLTASASPPSPTGIGTTVTVTAQASGCPNPNPLYQFWVLPPGGNAYQLLRAYSTTATLTWNTSGLAPGDYRFSIWARDVSSSGVYGNQFGRWDAYDNSLVYSVATPACSGLSASAAPASSAGIGTTVTVTAQASGCPDPNPLYQFWVLPPGGNAYLLQQAYSTTATFNWNTSGLAPGDYRFSIWARDANSTGLSGNQFGRWDAYNNSILYTLTAPACSGLSAYAAPASPTGIGTTVTVTAQASGCTDPNPLYQFWVLPPGGNAYLLQQAYSTTATFNWNTSGLAPGDYRFSIWARDANSTGLSGNQFGRWDAYNNSILYTLTAPACSGLGVYAAPASPAGIGSTVAIHAQAGGCTDPNPLYEFWVLAPGGNAYQLAQAYSTNSTFSWSTSGLAPGSYTFSIWTRDANSSGASGNQFGRWDAYNITAYTLTSCSSISATVLPPSPSGVGRTITVSAQAMSCPDPSPLYEFWVLAPGGTAYQLGQAYSTNSTFSWSTSGLAPGSYTFSIWTRDANSSGASGNQFGRWDAYNITAYTLTSCSGLQLSVSPASPSASGTTVTVTAQASGCPDPNPLYEFWVLPPGGNAYQLVQAYSASSTVAWNTTGLAPGTYRFSVWVRDTNSSGAQGNQFGTWDAYNDYTVYSLS